MDKNKLTVYKANKLIEASYGIMTIQEQLLLLSCISSCDPRKLNGETPVFVTVSEFADITDIEVRGAYDDLQRTAERLFNRYLVIDAPDPEDPDLTKTRTRWVHSINYYDGHGKISLWFAPKVLPYLAQLQGQFTKYKLRDVAQFKSSYGVRLYELLIQWQSSGFREIEIEWLRETWELKDKYPRLDNFKRKVINPAMNDINTHSNLWVKFGQRKQGRKIVAFQFQFGLKKHERKNITRKYIEKNSRPGESWEEARERLRA